MPNLGEYDGRPIVGMEISVRKTGDGLSKSLKVDAREIHIGEVGYAVLKWVCVDHAHPVENRKEPSDGGVIFKPILDALTVTFIDGDVVMEAVELQEQRIREWEDEQRGTPTLLDATSMRGDHILGEHDKALEDGAGIDGCTLCVEVLESYLDERDATAAEAAETGEAAE